MPLKSDKGTAGAIAIWIEDQINQAKLGNLTQYQFDALSSAGFNLHDFPLQTNESNCFQTNYSFIPTVKNRVIIALICGVVAAFPFIFGSGPAIAYNKLAPAALIATMLGIIAVLCDKQARIIPYELCGATLVFGILYQSFRFGIRSAFLSLAIGLGVALFVLLTERICNRFGKAGTIGKGDIRFLMPVIVFTGIPSWIITDSDLAYTSGAFLGLIVATVVGLIYLGISLLQKKITLKSSIPFAPFFAVWLIIGVIAPVLF